VGPRHQPHRHSQGNGLEQRRPRNHQSEHPGIHQRQPELRAARGGSDQRPPFDLISQYQFQTVPTHLRGFVVSEGQLVSDTDSNWWNGSLAQAELLSNPLFERYVGSSLGVTYQPPIG
jgi:hypothetical protein